MAVHVQRGPHRRMTSPAADDQHIDTVFEHESDVRVAQAVEGEVRQPRLLDDSGEVVAQPSPSLQRT